MAQSVGTLRVTVVDPSGAVIVGAQVDVRPSAPAGAAAVSMQTGARGDADFNLLEPGRYTIHVESPGFEPYDARDVRVRAGDNRREVKLAIAKLAETVDVGRDPRERASDPRSDAFATILGQAQIDELPDDPDEMEQALKDMAGPGAVLRVNGFRGGRLPSKDQIQQIRFRRNMFAADTHEAGNISVDITTKPGLERWRGATNAGLRGIGAQRQERVRADQRRRAERALRLFRSAGRCGPSTRRWPSADGTDAFDSKTIVAALPTGYFADSIRKPNTALNLSGRMEHALSKSQVAPGRSAAQPHVFGQSRRRRFRSARARLQPDAHGQSVPPLDVRLDSQVLVQRLSLSVPIRGHVVRIRQPRARRAGAERVQRGRGADWRRPHGPPDRHRRRSRHLDRQARAADGIPDRSGTVPHRYPAERGRHLHVRQPRRVQRRAADDVRAQRRRPLVSVSALQAGLYIQDDFRRARI